MKRNFSRGIKGFCFAVVMLSLFAVTSIPKITSSSATSIVHDYASDGTLLLLRSDDYNGTGEANYSSGGLSTILGGEWGLSLKSQSVRTVWITPNDAVGAQPAAPPASYYSASTEVKSICFDQNANQVPLGNVLTSSGNCKLGVTFNDGGTLYKLLMSPFPLSQPGDSPATCPSTGCPAPGVGRVICNKVSNGQCVSWTITPNTDAPNANVANLYRFSSQRRTSTWVYIGQYYNTFRIDVTTP